jgi:hypothetical protein
MHMERTVGNIIYYRDARDALSQIDARALLLCNMLCTGVPGVADLLPRKPTSRDIHAST